MVWALLEVQGWSKTVDLESGKTIDINSGYLTMVREIAKQYPYPGDENVQGIDWVTDVALALSQKYSPGFMILSYAQPYFLARFHKLSGNTWTEIVERLFSNINRFVLQSNFIPVVVGLGSLIPLQGCIDLSGLNGLTFTGKMSSRYAGFFDPGPGDIERLQQTPGIEKIISKNEFAGEFGGSQDFFNGFPDFFLAAEPGYIFKGFGSLAYMLEKISGSNPEIPVSSPFGPVKTLTDIRGIIENQLRLKKKIVLIILEGIGKEDFHLPFSMCSNRMNWYTYDQGFSHYLTILSGKHFQHHPYPPGNKYYSQNGHRFPFSGRFELLPDSTIGADYCSKRAAVGSRSIYTHVAGGADITIECFARDLNSYGIMAVVKDSV